MVNVYILYSRNKSKRIEIRQDSEEPDELNIDLYGNNHRWFVADRSMMNLLYIQALKRKNKDLSYCEETFYNKKLCEGIAMNVTTKQTKDSYIEVSISGYREGMNSVSINFSPLKWYDFIGYITSVMQRYPFNK